MVGRPQHAGGLRASLPVYVGEHACRSSLCSGLRWTGITVLCTVLHCHACLCSLRCGTLWGPHVNLGRAHRFRAEPAPLCQSGLGLDQAALRPAPAILPRVLEQTHPSRLPQPPASLQPPSLPCAQPSPFQRQVLGAESDPGLRRGGDRPWRCSWSSQVGLGGVKLTSGRQVPP